MKNKNITFIPILAVVIMLSSIIKLPSIFPGAEFQMSAPISVLIAMLFGAKIYITAGVLASFLSFTLSISNVYGIVVALVFRIGVIVFIMLVKNKNLCLIFSGAFGSLLSRIVLSKIVGVSFISLLLPAIPGMIMTGIISKILYDRLYEILKKYISVEGLV
ncbi:hypothetical protein ABID14_000481 [Peptoniphilus olsenii]|uniref:Uncharacterized protein n=1 Tax=Peptoniphilus olsenii TaxID=411570 RepID=A0ABV2J9B7_9FIRM